MTIFLTKSLLQTARSLALLLLVCACSDSSGPVGANTEDPVDSTLTELNDNGESSEDVVSDPLIQNTVPISFDITVPFYLSDELRLDLVWGDISLAADWVGGQFWSATGEFPAETVHPLVITFYDNFGAMELARHSQELRVGSNAVGAITISAEQFDTTQFDSDEDGVDNLTEVNAGRDPLVDEASLLDVGDAYALGNARGQYSRLSVSKQFESLLPDDRPFIDEIETEPLLNGVGQQVFGNFVFNIDADGNGTLTLNDLDTVSRFVPALSVTRSHSTDSITWAGKIVTSGSEYVHRETVASTVSVVDENLRRFVQDISGGNFGTYKFTWEITADLVGRRIPNSSLCKPVSGTASLTQRLSFNGDNLLVTNVSKDIDDQYWRIVETRNDTEVLEYFVRELKIVHDPDFPDSANFICDFVDF